MTRAARSTGDKILDAAERLVQVRGFNGWSYADIAEELKVTTASLHYHFPTKAALGTKLIERYTVTFKGALDALDQKERTAEAKLAGYAELYVGVLRKNRMCLCGMLAADLSTLPKEMREGIKRFFDDNEVWLASVLETGRKATQLRFQGTAVDQARFILYSLEGAMLVARSYGDPGRFTTAVDRLLRGLAAGESRPQ